MENNNDFFLEIFNNILKINEKEIIILFDNDGDIWFSLKDLIILLEYTNVKNAVRTIDINEKNKIKYENLRGTNALVPLKNIQPHQLFINESGLYELLLKSSKPIAKLFIEKYTQEIMPIIRKTGKYIMNNKDKQKLNELNTTIDNYKQEMTYYNDKYKFKPSDNGYLYINQNNSIKDGKEIVCFKIGYAENMKKRLKEYKVGNFKHKLLCYIPLDINRGDVEKCVKNKMKPHLLKLTTDTVCYTTLKDLKNEILECIDQIKTHICHCTLCKKTYEFNKLTTHECNKIGKFIDVDKEINSIGTKKGSKLTKSSKSSKKGSKLAKSSKSSKKVSKIAKSSEKGSKLVKSSKSSKKGSKLTKSSKKGSKLAK
jgi:prophage antirepressor-like protein